MTYSASPRENPDPLMSFIKDVRGYAIATLDVGGRFTSLNAGAEQMTGYQAAELIGASLARLYTQEDVEAGVVEEVLRRAEADGRFEGEALRVRKDGSRFWASLQLMALRGLDGSLRGYGVIAVDVSERRREEAALRARADELSTVLTSIGDGVIVTDERGRVTLLNPVAESLTGYSSGEACGRPLTDVFRIVNEHTRAPVDNPVAKVLELGRVVGLANHTMLIAKDGTERPIADSAAPVRDGSLTRGVVMVFRDQSAERIAERALRESEQRFRMLVESSKDYAIFMLDPKGYISSWNIGAQRMKGYRADEIIGQHFSRFYSREEVEAKKPDHELVVAEAEGRFEDEGYRIRKDGSRFWANVIITAVRDPEGNLRGFSKVTRDLTERKRIEEEARKLAADQAARAESERAARHLADVSGLLVASLDYRLTLDRLARQLVSTLADWCIVALRESAHLSIAHADPAQAELAEELGRDPALGLDERLDAGTITRASLGKLGARSAMVVPLSARGRTLGTLTLIASGSDRKYDDTDLALARDIGLRAGLAVDNALLYEQARQAIAVRDEFLSIASHELKTPLTALLLQLQSLPRLLAATPADLSRLQDRVSKTLAAASHLESLVQDLLDVSRITAGKFTLDFTETDLTAIVQEVMSRFGEEAERARCALELRHPGPVTVRCDRGRMDQVVTNLLGNALKYGSGKPVVVVVSQQDHAVAFEVSDEGIGVEHEHQRRIFERFERGVSERNYGGFGLGLWIAREIVEAHGGTIGVESAPGVGSTFRVVIPLAREGAS